MIVVGGVIPPADYEALYAAGAKAVFGRAPTSSRPPPT